MAIQDTINSLTAARDNLAAQLAAITLDPQIVADYSNDGESRSFKIMELTNALSEIDERLLKLQQRTPASYRLNRISR